MKKMLPEGKYVLFSRWDDDNSYYKTYGIFERKEYCLDAIVTGKHFFHILSF